MPYTGKVTHYGSDATTVLNDLTSRKVDASFTLRTQGGCGPGELRLKDVWTLRNTVLPGHYIAFDYEDGDRWYFGRVESITSDVPAGQIISLEGMSVELSELYPGGFGFSGDEPPRVWGKSDYFINDPDHDIQTFKTVSQPEDVVDDFWQNWIYPYTKITTADIEYASPKSGLSSVKFRGEETVMSIIRQLAITSKDASWGVDQNKKFFFKQKRANVLRTFRIGRDVQSVSRDRDRSNLYNRLQITGDYIYNGDAFDSSGIQTLYYGWYRYRAAFHVKSSIAQYGERRARLPLPWIRRNSDAQAFAVEFFRKYARLTDRYRIRTTTISGLPRPWEGQIRLEDTDGTELITSHFQTLKVEFGKAPVLEFELGPEDLVYGDDPREDRWELPQIPRRNFPPPSYTLPPTYTGTGSLSSEEITSSGGSSSSYDPCEPCQWHFYDGQWNLTYDGCPASCGDCAPINTLPDADGLDECTGDFDDPSQCFDTSLCGPPTTTTSTTTTACPECNGAFLVCSCSNTLGVYDPAGLGPGDGCSWPTTSPVGDPCVNQHSCALIDYRGSISGVSTNPDCTTTTSTSSTSTSTTSTSTSTTSTSTSTTSTSTSTSTTSTTTSTTSTTTSTTTTSAPTTTTSTTTTAGGGCTGICEFECTDTGGGYAWVLRDSNCSSGCGCPGAITVGSCPTCNLAALGTFCTPSCVDIS
jgi:hypothetical protein